LLVAGVLQCQEAFLLEHGLSHNLVEYLVLLDHLLALAETEPHHEGSSVGSLLFLGQGRHQEVVLGLTALCEITPATEEVAQLGVLLASRQTRDDLCGRHLAAKDVLAIVEKLSPQVEVLLSPHVGDVSVDQAVALVVLVDHVKSLAVPQSQEKALPILDVIAHDAMHASKSVLKVAHLIGCGMNLHEGHFALHVEILIQNLNKKLCDEHFDVRLVPVGNFCPLTVHLAHVAVVPLT